MQQLLRLAASATRAVVAGRTLPAALAAIWSENAGLEPRDRAFIQDAAYGVMRHLGKLEAVLEALAHKGVRDETLRHLLLVALYQLGYGRMPAHAVVDHTVRAVVDRGMGAKGFANAVLRNYLRRRERVDRAGEETPRGRFSYPEWWIAKVRAEFPDEYADILDAGNTRPPFTLRVNRRKIVRDEYLRLLREKEIVADPAGEFGVILAQPCSVSALPGFAEGWVSVQDLGAQLAGPLLDLRDGLRVLDACAAPGGKSAHMLELARIELTCLDSDAERMSRVGENLQRLGLEAKQIVGDAGAPSQWWDGQRYDRILADVPCTASGVVRRHPDVKWLRRQNDIAAFAAQQARILGALWSCLKPGGMLLYATCSVFAEENEAQVSALEARYAEAQRLPLSRSGQGGQILPSLAGAAHNQDGFFYTLFTKLSS